MGIETALLLGGLGLAGSAISAHGAQQAANTQVNAANQATQLQQHMFDTLRGDQGPFRQGGYSALGALLQQMGLGDPNSPSGAGSGDMMRNPTDISNLPPDFFSHQFDANDLQTNLAPNFGFMLHQGQAATTNMANAMGGLGGNSLQAVNEFSQNYAQNAYQQAFNNYNLQRAGIFDRFNTGQTNIFNRLATIAGLGQSTTLNGNNGASLFAGNMSNSIMGAGNAGAAGIVGGANALSGGISNLGNMYLLSQILGGAGRNGAGNTNGGP